MTRLDAPALTGDWLNAWLAAIGTTVLVPELGLSWTDDPVPFARLHHPHTEPCEAIASHFPTDHDLRHLAIAGNHPDSPAVFERHVDPDTYAQRASLARHYGDPTLAASVTDLHQPRDNELDHSPFDPPAPQGKTIWDRVIACREGIEDPQVAISRSFGGSAQRVKANGLGFDHRRFLSPADPVGDVWVDPVVEVLAFVALSMFPIRGSGTRSTTRGWTDNATKVGAFRWGVWTQVLTSTGIDALLDQLWNEPKRAPVTATYESVPYQVRATLDPTRGFAARRLQ